MDATWYLLFKVVASVALVIGSFLILVWHVKRFTRSACDASSNPLRLRGRLPVAPRAELLLVEAAGRLYLVGWSAKGFDVIDGLGEEGLELVEQERRARVEGAPHGVDGAVISHLLRLDRLRRSGTGDV